MKIDSLSVSPDRQTSEIRQEESTSRAGSDSIFTSVFEKTVSGINQDINTAHKNAENMSAGQPVDIAQTMISITKADITFRMLLQVRNKALSAYEEIMRLQF